MMNSRNAELAEFSMILRQYSLKTKNVEVHIKERYNKQVSSSYRIEYMKQLKNMVYADNHCKFCKEMGKGDMKEDYIHVLLKCELGKEIRDNIINEILKVAKDHLVKDEDLSLSILFFNIGKLLYGTTSMIRLKCSPW